MLDEGPYKRPKRVALLKEENVMLSGTTQMLLKRDDISRLILSK